MAQFLVTVQARHNDAAPQHLYLLDGELGARDIEALAAELLHDPVVQQARCCSPWLETHNCRCC
ncbi:MAG: hypothetical protein U0074_05205 [Kouleothrix sp.]